MKGMWCNILAKPNMRIIKNEISIPDQSEVDLIAFGAVGKSATVGHEGRGKGGRRVHRQRERNLTIPLVSFHLLALS